ncbi:MAG TPA: hypothetical protein VEK37_02180, partial [Gemmatimonadaceae bacterium]|nr:hypothetical protein [Gemmatimonadaceae bacterium]
MRQEIAVTALILDTENPRLEVQPSHRDAVRELFQAAPKKMLRLAEDIVEHGMLNPLEKVGVSPSEEQEGRYVVHEGNRRVAALLALQSPDLVTGTINDAAQKRLKELSGQYHKGQSIEQVECEVLPLDELKHWIALRHTGENEGAGIVGWGHQEQSRYLARIGARRPLVTQVLDSYIALSGGGPEEAARVRKVPATNLQRILETKAVRKKFGIKVNDKGWAFSDYPSAETFKWMRRIINDLSSGKLKVGDIYTAKKVEKYIDGFGDSDLPDADTALKEPIPIQPVSKADQPPTPPEERRQKTKRWSIREAKIHPKHPRLQDIMKELGAIPVEKGPNIHAVMLRVFLELSTDDFLARQGITVAPDKGKNTSLRARVLAA